MDSTVGLVANRMAMVVIKGMIHCLYPWLRVDNTGYS